MTQDLCRGCGVCCNEIPIMNHTYVEKFGKEKPPNTRCEALTQIGGGKGEECSIYLDPTKPSVCRTYLCGWREAEKIPLEYRPDKSRIVFSARETEKNGLVLDVAELEEGAFESEKGKTIINLVNQTATRKNASVFFYKNYSKETQEVYVIWSPEEEKKWKEHERTLA